jgi:hypothetical protein
MDVLSSTVLTTHARLAAGLDVASDMTPTPGEPRKGYERIDTFLQAAARHLNAVDAVLLSRVRHQLPDGARLTREYLAGARRLEIALATVKALEYGSVQRSRRTWASVWREVDVALAEHRRLEFQLVETLAEHLTGAQLSRLASRLEGTESHAPTRVHPYLPHRGASGWVARMVLRRVDAFWDTAEGRMTPRPPEPPRPPHGLLGQYVLGSPDFAEDDGTGGTPPPR